MDITTATPAARDIKPVWTPWFTPMHPESDEGAIYLGALVVIGVVDRGVRRRVECSHRDLYVTPRGEYLARFGDDEPDYGSLGMVPAGSVYAFAEKLAKDRAAALDTFVPCAWTLLLPDEHRTALPV